MHKQTRSDALTRGRTEVRPPYTRAVARSIFLALIAALALPGCTLCWPRGGAMGVCGGADDDDVTTDDDDVADDDDSTGDDDDSTADGMIAIPAGTFAMGCHQDLVPSGSCDDEELPVHTVSVSAFRMDAFEVTRQEFVDFINGNDNDCDEAPCLGGFSEPEVYEQGGTWFVLEGFETTAVAEVTWYGARDFCASLGKRLPTEAEWEWAAQGDTPTRYVWGDEDPDCKHAIYGGGCGEDGPWAVDDGIREAGRSPFGVWDMAGNVWEYVADRYSSEYYANSPEQDPPGPATGDNRVVRGGGWESNDRAIEAWSRWGRYAEFGNASVGFRCAADP